MRRTSRHLINIRLIGRTRDANQAIKKNVLIGCTRHKATRQQHHAILTRYEINFNERSDNWQPAEQTVTF